MTVRKYLSTPASMAVGISLLIGCSAVHKVAETAQLNGTSQTACTSNFKLASFGSGSELKSIKVVANQSTLKEVFFSDGNCSQETGEVQYQGSIDVKSALPNAPDATALDMTIDKTVAILDSDGAVNTANGIGLCDIKNWVKGQSQDISGKSCLTGEYPKPNAVFMTAYKLNGNTLSMADLPCRGSDHQTCSTDAPSESKRVVDLNLTYIKQ